MMSQIQGTCFFWKKNRRQAKTATTRTGEQNLFLPESQNPRIPDPESPNLRIPSIPKSQIRKFAILDEKTIDNFRWSFFWKFRNWQIQNFQINSPLSTDRFWINRPLPCRLVGMFHIDYVIDYCNEMKGTKQKSIEHLGWRLLCSFHCFHLKIGKYYRKNETSLWSFPFLSSYSSCPFASVSPFLYLPMLLLLFLLLIPDIFHSIFLRFFVRGKSMCFN